MKFAKSNYAGFDNSVLGLKLSKGDIFVVTSEIEESEVYQTGIATRNFVPVRVDNLFQLEKVVNLTGDLRAEFKKSIAPKVEEKVEEPEPVPEEQITIIHGPDVKLEDDESESITETEDVEEVSTDTAEVTDEQSTEMENDKPEEPVLAFTEDTKSWQAAVALVKKETDIKKLAFALRNDERKSVKKACVARLSELREEK